VQVHRVVQEVGHEPRDEGLIRERHVDHVVELSKGTRKTVNFRERVMARVFVIYLSYPSGTGVHWTMA
jgi:hypothetical protein